MRHTGAALMVVLFVVGSSSCKSKPPPPPTGWLAFQPPVIEKFLGETFSTTDDPHVSGKWLFIDADNREWSGMNYQFPKERIAQTPSEIGTLFLEHRTQTQVAEYTGGIKAMSEKLTIEVVDFGSRVTCASRTFESKGLPRRIQRAAGDTRPELAGGDNGEILAWLKSLAER